MFCIKFVQLPFSNLFKKRNVFFIRSSLLEQKSKHIVKDRETKKNNLKNSFKKLSASECPVHVSSLTTR